MDDKAANLASLVAEHQGLVKTKAMAIKKEAYASELKLETDLVNFNAMVERNHMTKDEKEALKRHIKRVEKDIDLKKKIRGKHYVDSEYEGVPSVQECASRMLRISADISAVKEEMKKSKKQKETKITVTPSPTPSATPWRDALMRPSKEGNISSPGWNC